MEKSTEGVFAGLVTAIELVPTALVMVDRSGTIALVNREVELLFGYARDELVGRHVEVLIPERFAHGHSSLRSDYAKAPQARRMGAGRDLFALKKDGTEFPVEIGLNPIAIPEGRFVMSAIVDITERKHLEGKLRELNEDLESRVRQRTAELAHSNEALERSNMSLREFAYIASHDLRAPLRSISGFAQLLHEEHGTALGSEAEDWIRRIVENSQRMHTLIEDLLTYSRVDSRARAYEPVKLNSVLDDALSMISAAISEVGGTVTRDELPVVSGDRSQLVQLMQNLVENGLKYRGAEPPVIHVGCERDSDGWLVSVSDNGIGIEPKHHEKIFEIFRRLHSSHTHSGTGIGLAICRRVVGEHGGRIWVSSSPGEGSTFYFTIPDHPGKEAE